MKGLAQWAVRALANKLDAYDVDGLPDVLRVGRATYVRLPDAPNVDLPMRNPFGDDEARGYRSEAALMMMDEETFGFMLVVLRRDDGKKPEIALRVQTESEWIPAFHASMGRILIAG